MQSLDYVQYFYPFLEKVPKETTITIDGIDYTVSGDNLIDENTGRPPSKIYIVMDKLPIKNDPKNPSDYIEVVCKEDLDITDPLYATAIVCDLNGDGRNDIEGGGNRGWLDLTNGGGGTSDLRDWIKNGLDFPITPHTWRSGEPGTTTPVYEDVKTYRQGEVVLIPVFNAYCDDTDPLLNSACMAAAHASPWDPEPATGDIDDKGSKPKFHIITFEPFYISCVHTKKKDDCPGFKWAQDLNNTMGTVIRDNTPSIEGFFITNYEVILDAEQPCLINMGNCEVSLMK
jgi:hypothetical protein